jgi:hypothetical protein
VDHLLGFAYKAEFEPSMVKQKQTKNLKKQLRAGCQ